MIHQREQPPSQNLIEVEEKHQKSQMQKSYKGSRQLLVSPPSSLNNSSQQQQSNQNIKMKKAFKKFKIESQFIKVMQNSDELLKRKSRQQQLKDELFQQKLAKLGEISEDTKQRFQPVETTGETLKEHIKEIQDQVDQALENQNVVIDKQYNFYRRRLNRMLRSLQEYLQKLKDLQNKLENQKQMKNLIRDLNNYTTFSNQLKQDLHVIEAQIIRETIKKEKLKQFVKTQLNILQEKQNQNLQMTTQITLLDKKAKQNDKVIKKHEDKLLKSYRYQQEDYDKSVITYNQDPITKLHFSVGSQKVQKIQNKKYFHSHYSRKTPWASESFLEKYERQYAQRKENTDFQLKMIQQIKDNLQNLSEKQTERKINQQQNEVSKRYNFFDELNSKNTSNRNQTLNPLNQINEVEQEEQFNQNSNSQRKINSQDQNEENNNNNDRTISFDNSKNQILIDDDKINNNNNDLEKNLEEENYDNDFNQDEQYLDENNQNHVFVDQDTSPYKVPKGGKNVYDEIYEQEYNNQQQNQNQGSLTQLLNNNESSIIQNNNNNNYNYNQYSINQSLVQQQQKNWKLFLTEETPLEREYRQLNEQINHYKQKNQNSKGNIIKKSSDFFELFKLLEDGIDSEKLYLEKLEKKIQKKEGLNGSYFFELRQQDNELKSFNKMLDNNDKVVKTHLMARQINSLMHDTLQGMLDKRDQLKKQSESNQKIFIDWENFNTLNPIQLLGLLSLRPKVLEELKKIMYLKGVQINHQLKKNQLLKGSSIQIPESVNHHYEANKYHKKFIKSQNVVPKYQNPPSILSSFQKPGPSTRQKNLLVKAKSVSSSMGNLIQKSKGVNLELSTNLNTSILKPSILGYTNRYNNKNNSGNNSINFNFNEQIQGSKNITYNFKSQESSILQNNSIQNDPNLTILQKEQLRFL